MHPGVKTNTLSIFTFHGSTVQSNSSPSLARCLRGNPICGLQYKIGVTIATQCTVHGIITDTIRAIYASGKTIVRLLLLFFYPAPLRICGLDLMMDGGEDDDDDDDNDVEYIRKRKLMDLYHVRQGVGQLEKETPWERIPPRCWTVGL